MMESKKLGFKGFRIMMFVLVVPVTFWIVIRWGAGVDGDVIGPTIGWTVITAASLVYSHGMKVRKVDNGIERKRRELKGELSLRELVEDE